MTDAFLSGYAMCEGDLSAEEVSRLGRWDERWRFKWGDVALNPPQAAALVARAEFLDPSTVLSSVSGEALEGPELDEKFPEVR